MAVFKHPGAWEDEEEDAGFDVMERFTLVLVGRTGNGKSATGNSILGPGTRRFESRRSPRSVTTTCQLENTVKEDGRCVSVIDTPGLFDSTITPQDIQKEICRCIELAREGIHAIVLVLSTRNRFSLEEMAAVESLQTIFGERVVDYMIVVFTGGDELEDEGQSLEQYLQPTDSDSAEHNALQDLLQRCGNRKLLFDNKTKDLDKLEAQTAALLAVVDDVLAANEGKPYSNDLFREAQDIAATLARERELDAKLALGHDGSDVMAKRMLKEWREEQELLRAEQLKVISEMVEAKLRSTAEKQQRILEERLALEKQAREEAERGASQAAASAREEIHRLREQLQEAEKRRAEQQHRSDSARQCLIL